MFIPARYASMNMTIIPFEELPDDWTCPICGAPKDVFIKKNNETTEE